MAGKLSELLTPTPREERAIRAAAKVYYESQGEKIGPWETLTDKDRGCFIENLIFLRGHRWCVPAWARKTMPGLVDRIRKARDAYYEELGREHVER